MTEPRLTDLSQEERTLAEQLVRVAPRSEPSPALDARVLAAARAASGGEGRRSVRSSRRWPVAVGLVASLVLAVGIAWRVRPLPPAVPSAASEAARPTSASTPVPAQPNVAPTAAVSELPDIASPAAEAASKAKAGMPGRATAARENTAASTADIGPEQPSVAEAPPPAPPPAAPAARTAPQSQSPAPEADINAATDAAGVQADIGSDASATAAEAMPESGYGDEPVDAMPPATADAPGVRDAWLLRIRTLVDDGRIAEGRRSLRAFAERYPDYPLPEDLRALLR
jgi:hypothetical protein